MCLLQQTVTANAEGYAAVLAMVEGTVKVREVREAQQAIKKDVMLVEL
jgi:hypothetical protein